jgi:hypothetical protein
MRYAIALLLMVALGRADEIQTKDGKKVEFKLLADEGDSWELTTPQGTKVTVKKADFERFIPGGVKDSPLTGASITFDRKRKLETVDLLKSIDPKRDCLTGTWQTAGKLSGQGAPNVIAKCQLSAYATVPEEYDLTVDVARKDGTDEAAFGLIGGGKQFLFVFDRLNSSWNGLYTDQAPEHNNLGVPAKFFTNGKPRTVVFMVRREAFVVQVDGKDFLAWKADWPKAQIYSPYAVQMKNVLFIATGQSQIQITRMILSAPKEKQ